MVHITRNSFGILQEIITSVLIILQKQIITVDSDEAVVPARSLTCYFYVSGESPDDDVVGWGE
jgi:hypothetical protein